MFENLTAKSRGEFEGHVLVRSFRLVTQLSKRSRGKGFCGPKQGPLGHDSPASSTGRGWDLCLGWTGALNGPGKQASWEVFVQIRGGEVLDVYIKAIELLSIQISEPFARLTKSFKRERGLFVFRACQNLSRNRI